MRYASKTKIAFFALLSAVSICITSSVFSQGREFERTRVLSVPSPQGKYYGGGESEDYRILPGDVLEIIVWREPELTRDVRVRPDGKFSYPLIGQVQAGGLTVAEIQDSMRESLVSYVKFPEVTVSVKESVGSAVIVLGEVMYPGIYTYKGQGDVLTAIGLAGDFTGNAKRESVLVISDNFSDKPEVRRVNVFRSFRHGAAGTDFLLKPNDVVYVPKTFIGDWNKTVNDLQPTLNSLLGTNAQYLFQDRFYIRSIYYNRDKPVAKQAD
jgi:polysaccharide export outer membrane protein